MVHHYNIFALGARANIGECYICKILLARLETLYGTREIYTRNLGSKYYGAFRTDVCWKKNVNLSEKDRLYFYFTDPMLEREPVWNCHNFFRMDLWPADTFKDKFTTPHPIKDNHSAEIFRQRQSNTGAPASRALAVSWLARCTANEDGLHRQCSRKSAEYLPTRLLDVRKSESTSKLRLVDSSVKPELFVDAMEWLTLSHCWGEWGAKNNPILTTANLEERHNSGVSLANLPKTFQDAVEIAKWFNSKW